MDTIDAATSFCVLALAIRLTIDSPIRVPIMFNDKSGGFLVQSIRATSTVGTAEAS